MSRVAGWTGSSRHCSQPFRWHCNVEAFVWNWFWVQWRGMNEVGPLGAVYLIHIFRTWRSKIFRLLHSIVHSIPGYVSIFHFVRLILYLESCILHFTRVTRMRGKHSGLARTGNFLVTSSTFRVYFGFLGSLEVSLVSEKGLWS